MSFVHCFEECTKSIRIEPGIAHQVQCHQTGFKFLISAVSQKRRVDSERNAELSELFLPGLGGRQARGDSDRRLYDQLPGQLCCSMARCDVPDFVREDGRDFIVVGCALKQAAIDVNRPARKTK